MKELTYLAQKEKKIIDGAQQIIDEDIQAIVGEHIKLMPKLEQAITKIVDKMDLLEDYYAVWKEFQNVKFKTVKAKDNVDKQIYSFITKTYAELKSLQQIIMKQNIKFRIS